MGNRVIIPACVINVIRTKYAEEDGQYTAFKNNIPIKNKLKLLIIYL